MSNGTFDFNAFLRESKDVLVNPKSYFSTMRTSGGMTEPLIKAVIYGVVAGAIAFIWSFLKIGAATGGFWGGTIGIMVFISYIIGAIIGLFIGAVILLIISSICKGNTDFEANLRATASLMVIMPVSAFLGFTGHFSLYLGVIISLAVNIFSLWLLYNALIEALKAKPETTKIVMYILAILFVIFMLVGFGAKRRANQLMREFNNTEINQLMK
jgi:hypothetical protein